MVAYVQCLLGVAKFVITRLAWAAASCYEGVAVSWLQAVYSADECSL